jgi:hypothetical protein
MFTATINGILIDGFIGSFEDVRARAHAYFVELLERGYIRTLNGIVHGSELEITPIDLN